MGRHRRGSANAQVMNDSAYNDVLFTLAVVAGVVGAVVIAVLHRRVLRGCDLSTGDSRTARYFVRLAGWMTCVETVTLLVVRGLTTPQRLLVLALAVGLTWVAAVGNSLTLEAVRRAISKVSSKNSE